MLNKNYIRDNDKNDGNKYNNTRFFNIETPNNSLIKKGIPSKIAYEIIHNQLKEDGNPSLNLASFVTTHMETEADKLILENIGKNFVNAYEYPQTYKFEKYCIDIIGKLFNAPNISKTIGYATIGSSEAIILGLLAHKWSWKKNMEKNITLQTDQIL